jgi:hypothetical protein
MANGLNAMASAGASDGFNAPDTCRGLSPRAAFLHDLVKRRFGPKMG